MRGLPETLVVAAYIFVDEEELPRLGASGEITDGELVALAVAQSTALSERSPGA
jgi:hypothetical protein